MVLIALACAATPASAATWERVLRDCVLHDDGLHGSYTRSQLQEAKRNVTGERLAYTECLAEISAAMNATHKAKGGSSDGTGNGDDAFGGIDPDLNGDGVVTPAEKRKAKKIAERQRDDVDQANNALRQDVAGGVGDDDSSSGDGGLGLALAIAAIALLAIGAAAWYAARRNPTIANALRRVPLPGRHS
jgi:hypothetical protein